MCLQLLLHEITQGRAGIIALLFNRIMQSATVLHMNAAKLDKANFDCDENVES